MRKIVIFIIFITFTTGLAQTDKSVALTQIQQNLFNSYKNGKLDDAFKFAAQSLDLCLKEFGEVSSETATAYTNMATIQSERKKYKESIESYQKAVNIYENLPKLNGKELIDAINKLAFTQFLSGNKKESEINYLKVYNLIEAKFGQESKESISTLINIANFYVQVDDTAKSDEFYLKSYAVVVKNFGNKSEKVEQIDDAHTCMVYSKMRMGSKIGEFKLFESARSKILGEPEELKDLGEKVVNGKAKLLVKPPYPQEARALRLQGTVAVKVTIDELGNVSSAKAACGIGYLENVSVEAAKKSKFSPTLVGDKAVKVTGIIVYNFTAM